MVMKTNTKTNSWARVALGATAVLALTGQAHAATFVTDCATSPAGPADATTGSMRAKASVGGAGTTYADCETAPGWYVEVLPTTDNQDAGDTMVLKKAPVTHYAPGGIDIMTAPARATPAAATDYTTAGLFFCPANSRTGGTGGTSLDACDVDAGYYLKVASATRANVVIEQAPIGWYAGGGETLVSGNSVNVAAAALDKTTALADVASVYSNAALSACPYAGSTTAAGKTALSDCTPDCVNTNTASKSNANANTCRCDANYYGTPTDASGNTAGPAAGGCTACPTNMAATIGSTLRSACNVVVAQASYATIFSDPDHATTGLAAQVTLTDSFASTSVSGTSITMKACPEGLSSSFDFTGTVSHPVASFCNRILPNYYGVPGSDNGVISAGTATKCPANSVSSGSLNAPTTYASCTCIAGFASANNKCVQCPANTYKAAGDSIGSYSVCLGCAVGYESAAGAAACTKIAVPETTPCPAAASVDATKSGATGVSVIAAISTVAAAQLML